MIRLEDNKETKAVLLGLVIYTGLALLAGLSPVSLLYGALVLLLVLSMLYLV